MLVNQEEYYEDMIIGKSTYHIMNKHQAVELVNNTTHKRLEEIYKTHHQPLAIMLSGGNDSTHTLAVAAQYNIPARAYTVILGNDSEEEKNNAIETASHFGIEHVLIQPSNEEIIITITEIITALETTEPWEILAGLTFRLINKRLSIEQSESPLVSATGADVLFPIEYTSQGGINNWHDILMDSITRKFTKNRFIPDFYHRILGDRKHYKIWQTETAVKLAQSINPVLLIDSQGDSNKQIIKDSLLFLGCPLSCISTIKKPMQETMGGFSLLPTIARHYYHKETLGKTYSNPLEEDEKVLISRLFLDKLATTIR